MGKYKIEKAKTSYDLTNPESDAFKIQKDSEMNSTTKIFEHQKERPRKLCDQIQQYLELNLSKNCRTRKGLKGLKSILNLSSEKEKEVPASAFNLPSIQNLVSFSECDLNSLEEYSSLDSESATSFKECFEIRSIESEPEMMLSYIILVDRVFNKIGKVLDKRQNEKVIKGIWNIVLKYWQDIGDGNQYQNVSPKVQWGLFKLLNFDIRVNTRDRVLKQAQINNLLRECQKL